jgi:hypothetical protein
MPRHSATHDAFMSAFTGVDASTSKLASDHTFDRFLAMIYGGATVETYEVADDMPAPLTMDRKALDWTDFRHVRGTDYMTAEKSVAFRRKSISQRIVEAVELLSGGSTDMDVVAVVHTGMFLVSPVAEDPELVDALIARHLATFHGFTGSTARADRSEVEVLLRAHRRSVAAALQDGRSIQEDGVADYHSGAELDRVTIIRGARQMFVYANPVEYGAKP